MPYKVELFDYLKDGCVNFDEYDIIEISVICHDFISGSQDELPNIISSGQN